MPEVIHNAARMGVDMPLCSRRAWMTASRLPTCPRPGSYEGASLAVSQDIPRTRTRRTIQSSSGCSLRLGAGCNLS